jgi:magnesium transporter
MQEAIQALLDDSSLISSFFDKYHSADIAETLEMVGIDQQLGFFMLVPPKLNASVFEHLDLHHQIELAKCLSNSTMSAILTHMSRDNAVDLLDELNKSNADISEQLLIRLPKSLSGHFQELLTYPDNSAGAIMDSRMVIIPENLLIKDAIASVRLQADLLDKEHGFHIFITDHKKRLVGFTTLADILLSNDSATIKSIRSDNPIAVPVTMSRHDVVMVCQKYDLSIIPVIDDQDVLIGIITSDDIMDVVIEEATEDLYKLSGTHDISEAQLLGGSIWRAIRSRMPWLLLTIFGGIASASLIHTYANRFQFAEFSLALSLSFVPLLMGLGGNIGNQSATIFVRSLSTGFIKLGQAKGYIGRECFVGWLMGGLLAIVLFGLTMLMNNSLLFSAVVSLALWLNMSLASLIGASLPVMFNRLSIDPAVASAPFISMSLDIISQLVYFSLTLFILGLL